MKNLSRFMDEHLGYFLVIPALIFIILFSIWPILESTKFSFFDFQLNDQQKSGLYFSERYNLDLMNETYEYIDYYLEIELDTVAKEETKEAIVHTAEMINSEYADVLAMFPAENGIVKLSGQESQMLLETNQRVMSELTSLYEKDDTFSYKKICF